MQKNSTVALLSNHGIDYTKFGVGSAKTLAHLEQEVASGESVLAVEHGFLLRLTTVLYVNVRCQYHGKNFTLTEDRQVFSDGRVRRRSLPSSLAEKLQAGELPTQKAVLRAVSEELRISRVKSLTLLRSEVREEDSPSYPGIRARFTNYFWGAELYMEDFRPEGYTEVQADKSSYFVWKKEE